MVAPSLLASQPTQSSVAAVIFCIFGIPGGVHTWSELQLPSGQGSPRSLQPGPQCPTLPLGQSLPMSQLQYSLSSQSSCLWQPGLKGRPRGHKEILEGPGSHYPPSNVLGLGL